MFKTAKSKLFALGAATLAAANSAMAAITVDSSSGEISGSLDLAPFMTGAAVVITAMAGMFIVKKVILLLRG